MSFSNKVVVITGAGGGIGGATSKYFYQQLATLVLIDINDQTLASIKKQLENLKGSSIPPLYIAADLSKEVEVRRIVSTVADKYGMIDVLINNAAISAKDSILEENFLEHYEKTYAINLYAPMLLTHLAVPYLERVKGNVINITSVGGVKPLPNCTVYNTSKAALRHFTKCAAMELAPRGVRVNSIVPAGVKSEMVKSLGITDVDAHNKRRAKQLPLQQMIETEEVAELIGILASDRARSVTGAEHVIDAGHLLGGEKPRYSDD